MWSKYGINSWEGFILLNDKLNDHIHIIFDNIFET